MDDLRFDVMQPAHNSIYNVVIFAEVSLLLTFNDGRVLKELYCGWVDVFLTWAKKMRDGFFLSDFTSIESQVK